MRNKPFLLQQTILNVLLVLAIGASVVLSALTFKSFGPTETASQSATQQSNQQLIQVFRPTQYIVTQAKGQQHVVLKTDSKQIKMIKNALMSARFSDAQTTTVSSQRIEKILSTKSSLTLRYPDVIPID